MKPFIRIFTPDEDTRFEFWVILFLPDVAPETHVAQTPFEAEQIAHNLANQHSCGWRYQPEVPTWGEAPWWDEEGNLRKINRIEFVKLENGIIQFNLFSDKHRLSTEVISVGDFPHYLKETTFLMADLVERDE